MSRPGLEAVIAMRISFLLVGERPIEKEISDNQRCMDALYGEVALQ